MPPPQYINASGSSSAGPAAGGSWSAPGWSGSGEAFVAAAATPGTYSATVTANRAYTVSVNYVADAGRTAAVSYAVHDGATLLGTVVLNEKVATVVSSNQMCLHDASNSTDYSYLGTFTITGTTLNVVVTGDGAGFAETVQLRVEDAGPAGTPGLLPAGFAPVSGTTVVFTPDSTDPAGATVTTFRLSASLQALVSTAADGFSGNARLSVRFYPNGTGGSQQCIAGVRTSAATFTDGYYATAAIDTGQVLLDRYNAGTATHLASVTVTGGLNAAHLYELIIEAWGSTAADLLVRCWLNDLTAGTWADPFGGLTSTLQCPYADVLDSTSFGGTPINGAGHSVLSAFGAIRPLQESLVLDAAPTPGSAEPDLLMAGHRFTAAGVRAQLFNPDAAWDPVARVYWLVGIDSHLGAQTIGGAPAADPATVRLYSTPDLITLTDHGTILGLTVGGTTYDWYVEPKLLRNPTTGHWFLFAQGLVGNVMDSSLVVLSGTSPLALSTVVSAGMKPSGFGNGPIGSPNVFLDPSGGALYLLLGYGIASDSLQIATFSADWSTLGAATVFSVGSPADGPHAREAPIMWKTGSNYYLMYSQQTGWADNPNYISKATSVAGPWTACPFPFSSAIVGQANSYNTQCVSVLQTPAGEDYWLAGDNHTADFSLGLVWFGKIHYDGSANPTIPYTGAFVPAAPPVTAIFLAGLLQGISLPMGL